LPAAPPPSRLRRWLLAAAAGAILAFLLGAGWREVALRSLAADWGAAHAARDLAAMEALYCWEGVDAAERQRIRLALLQEIEMPVAAVRGARLSPSDRLPWGSRRPNLDPVGVLEVSFAVEDGLASRILVGRSGLRFRLVVLVPSGS